MQTNAPQWLEFTVVVPARDLEELRKAQAAAGLPSFTDATDVAVSTHYGIRARIEHMNRIAQTKEKPA